MIDRGYQLPAFERTYWNQHLRKQRKGLRYRCRAEARRYERTADLKNGGPRYQLWSHTFQSAERMRDPLFRARRKTETNLIPY